MQKNIIIKKKNKKERKVLCQSRFKHTQWKINDKVGLFLFLFLLGTFQPLGLH